MIIEVSDSLRMPREEAMKSAWTVPTGFQLAWMEMLEEEKRENNKIKSRFDILDL